MNASISDKFREGFTINDNTRNEFAAYGIELLKYAVLDALYKERANRWKGLLRIRIRQRLGIPKPGEYDAPNADLIGGILWHLEKDEYVEDIGNNRWRITEKEISFIEA